MASDFDRLLAGAQETAMFLAPTKAKGMKLKVVKYDKTTSKFAVDESNPDGVIPVLRVEHEGKQYMLRLPNRLLIAMREATERLGKKIEPGTTIKVTPQGSGYDTTYSVDIL